jgi:hypothetical protein
MHLVFIFTHRDDSKLTTAIMAEVRLETLNPKP